MSCHFCLVKYDCCQTIANIHLSKMLLPKAGYKINIIIYSKKSIKEKLGRWLMDGGQTDYHSFDLALEMMIFSPLHGTRFEHTFTEKFLSFRGLSAIEMDLGM